MLVPWLTSLDGTLRLPLFSVGPYGAWGDLTYQTRWGTGACGMYEASWPMPLPPDFSHPLLRRGSLVELMDGPYRVGSPLILAEPAVGAGLDDPWKLVATGVGREVEGENSFYAFDGSGNTSTIGTTVVDQAIARGWRIAGRDSTIPASGTSASSTSAPLNTVAAILNSIADLSNSRWGVKQDNTVGLLTDPTTPTYQVTPSAVALGTADDDYATVVYVRYVDSTTHTYATVFSPATASATELTFGRKEYPVDLTSLGQLPAANAQGFADRILALSKGRLAWTNSLTLTSNQILTAGGVPADLSILCEDVGKGCMVRLHGIWSDLLAYNGQTWLDIVIGQAQLVDGAQSIQLNPIGLAARDLASIVESVTGVGDVAA